ESPADRAGSVLRHGIPRPSFAAHAAPAARNDTVIPQDSLRKELQMITTEAAGPMTAEEMIALTKRHTIFSWSAQASVNPIAMVRGEGIYFWDADGKRYMDMNSQLMCVNIGHGDKRVIEAIKRQADELVYAGPGMASPVRARVGKMLADLTPGDLNRFFF